MSPTAAVSAASFPGDDALCEKCGYRLCGLDTQRDCPECGTPIAASHPRRREGLPWQHRPSPRTWLATAGLIIARPGPAFERLRIDQPGRDADGNPQPATNEVAGQSGATGGSPPSAHAHPTAHRDGHPQPAQHTALSNHPEANGHPQPAPHTALSNRRDRAFLLSVTLPLGLLWGAAWLALGLPRVAIWAAGATVAILALTYIEAIGVTWFSRRRGWRVPFRLAERVVCYAAVAWFPAAVVCCALAALHVGPIDWQRRFTLGLFHGDERDYPWLVLIGAVSILWFESLVWLGIRRVRYANAGGNDQ